jgi:hypothetical protein
LMQMVFAFFLIESKWCKISIFFFKRSWSTIVGGCWKMTIDEWLHWFVSCVVFFPLLQFLLCKPYFCLPSTQPSKQRNDK